MEFVDETQVFSQQNNQDQQQRQHVSVNINTRSHDNWNTTHTHQHQLHYHTHQSIPHTQPTQTQWHSFQSQTTQENQQLLHIHQPTPLSCSLSPLQQFSSQPQTPLLPKSAPELSHSLKDDDNLESIDYSSVKKIPGKHCNVCHQLHFSGHNETCWYVKNKISIECNGTCTWSSCPTFTFQMTSIKKAEKEKKKSQKALEEKKKREQQKIKETCRAGTGDLNELVKEISPGEFQQKMMSLVGGELEKQRQNHMKRRHIDRNGQDIKKKQKVQNGLDDIVIANTQTLVDTQEISILSDDVEEDGAHVSGLFDDEFDENYGAHDSLAKLVAGIEEEEDFVRTREFHDNDLVLTKLCEIEKRLVTVGSRLELMERSLMLLVKEKFNK